MNKLLFIFITSTIAIPLMARRSVTQRSYEILGLSNSKEISESLKVGIPLLLIGFIIAYVFMWGREKKDGPYTNIGFIGFVLMIIGGVYLIPLLTWVEYIFVSLYSVFITLLILAVLLYGISTILKRK